MSYRTSRSHQVGRPNQARGPLRLLVLLSLLILQLGWLAVPTPAQQPTPVLFWSNLVNGKIQRIEVDGTRQAEVLDLESSNDPYSIAIDSGGGKIYWSDRYAGIWRANLDGTDPEQIYPWARTPHGLTLDVDTGSIYWTEYQTRQVLRGSLDGAATPQVIVSSTGENPEGIALDKLHGKLYWVNNGVPWAGPPQPGSLQRANLDGTQVETLLENLNAPTGIVVDAPNNYLYVASWEQAWQQGQVRGGLHRARLDGSEHTVLRTGMGLPLQVSLDSTSGRLYWANEDPPSVQSSDLHGGDLRTIVTDIGTGEKGPYGLALLDRSVLRQPSLIWAPLVGIAYGTPLGGAQLNATADVPGTFSYDPPLGTVLPAGEDWPLSVTFIPDSPLIHISEPTRPY